MILSRLPGEREKDLLKDLDEIVTFRFPESKSNAAYTSQFSKDLRLLEEKYRQLGSLITRCGNKLKSPKPSNTNAIKEERSNKQTEIALMNNIQKLLECEIASYKRHNVITRVGNPELEPLIRKYELRGARFQDGNIIENYPGSFTIEPATINLHGVTLSIDHTILSNKDGWRESVADFNMHLREISKAAHAEYARAQKKPSLIAAAAGPRRATTRDLRGLSSIYANAPANAPVANAGASVASSATAPPNESVVTGISLSEGEGENNAPVANAPVANAPVVNAGASAASSATVPPNALAVTGNSWYNNDAPAAGLLSNNAGRPRGNSNATAVASNAHSRRSSVAEYSRRPSSAANAWNSEGEGATGGAFKRRTRKHRKNRTHTRKTTKRPRSRTLQSRRAR